MVYPVDFTKKRGETAVYTESLLINTNAAKLSENR